jgi:hypothetical protein
MYFDCYCIGRVICCILYNRIYKKTALSLKSSFFYFFIIVVYIIFYLSTLYIINIMDENTICRMNQL